MSIEEIQQEIREEFGLFPDWTGKYEYLIDLGKQLPLIDDEYRVEENLVRGCQSRVWLHAESGNGVIHFTADSDAVITKGIIALLIRVLSGQPAREIAGADLHFIPEIGLDTHLSPTRSNGLRSMIKQMKHYAIALMAKEEA